MLRRLLWVANRLRYVEATELAWRMWQLMRQALYYVGGVRLHWSPTVVSSRRCALLVEALGEAGFVSESAIDRFDPLSLRPFPLASPTSRVGVLSTQAATYDVSGVALRFGPWINYRRDSLGDIRDYWERCRLAWLVQEVDEAPNPGHLLEARCEEFLRSAPPLRGSAWVSGLEGASRAVSIIASAGVAYKRGGPTAWMLPASRILRGCADLIALTESRGSSRNNHALGERVASAALHWVCGSSDAIVRHALHLASDEFLAQTWEDGSGREIATGYWSYNVEWGALLLGLHRAAQIAPAPELRDRVYKAVNAAASLRSAVPGLVIGDTDDATVWARFWPRRSFPPASDVKKESIETVLFRAGVAIAEVHQRPKVVVACRAGRFGHPGMAPHSHADQLSLYMFVDGAAFITDSGSDRYFGKSIRENLRTEVAHPTISIDEDPQAVAAGRFLWIDQHDADLELLPTGFRASLRLKRASITRSADWSSGHGHRITVTDKIDGDFGRRIQWNWPLAHGVTAMLAGENLVRLNRENASVCLSWRANGATECIIEPTSLSPGYGAIETGLAIRVFSSDISTIEWSFDVMNGRQETK